MRKGDRRGNKEEGKKQERTKSGIRGNEGKEEGRQQKRNS